MARATYDRDADALYISLDEGEVARTVEADDYRILDLDEAGSVLGLEVLYPNQNLQIAALARHFNFENRLDEIDEAVGAALGVGSPTRVTVALAWVLPAPAGSTPLIESSRSQNTSSELITTIG